MTIRDFFNCARCYAASSGWVEPAGDPCAEQAILFITHLRGIVARYILHYNERCLAAALTAFRRFHLGYALLFSSMAGSLMFGIAFHFVADTPDSVVNVCGGGARMFLVSAVLLALVELAGTVWAAVCWRRLVTIRSSDLHSVVAE